MSKVDCGVFPARAEGWNLELIELMAVGRQVITTNFSAHTEFCTAANSRLIDIKELEPANDGVWFDGTKGRWAKFDEDTQHDLVAHMRAVHEEKQAGRLILNKEGVETARRFTWDNTAKEILRNVQ
jgi:glycosyltransferase involved in cell wall biosynthesis